MSNLIASDDRNPEFVGARNPDAVLHVTFYTATLQDNFKTEKEGHPIFYDQPWVTIVIPGRNDLTVGRPVYEDDKDRFPMQWQRYLNKTATAEGVAGTPVTEWAALTRAQAEELKGQKFYTVEQIANCSDGQIQALGMNANSLRVKARAFLANAKDTALSQSQAAELARKDQEIADLKAGQQRLSEQMQQLIAAQAAAPAPKRIGRPRKVKEDTPA